MFSSQIDLARHKKGYVVDLLEGCGKTGFQVKMLIHREEFTYDIAPDVYREFDEGRYGCYPSTAEFLYIPLFDEHGTIQQLVKAGAFGDGQGIVKTHIEFGTTKMFVRAITAETPTVGHFFTIEGNKIIFRNMAESKEAFTYLDYSGQVPAPEDGMSLQLAPDAEVYIWDWTKANRPFTTSITREEAIAANFVTSYQCGTLEDLKKNGYWIDMMSTRGDDQVIDLISCFLNQPPGWEK